MQNVQVNLATATDKKIELGAESSCYSLDVLCNDAKLHNSTKIEAEIHNSSCDLTDSWFTAKIEAEIHNFSCDSTGSWFTAEIEAEIHNSSCDSTDSWFTAEIEAEIHNSSCDSIDTWSMAAGPDPESN